MFRLSTFSMVDNVFDAEPSTNWRLKSCKGLELTYKTVRKTETDVQNSLHGRPSSLHFLPVQMSGSQHSRYGNWVHWFNHPSDYMETTLVVILVITAIAEIENVYLNDHGDYVEMVFKLSQQSRRSVVKFMTTSASAKLFSVIGWSCGTRVLKNLSALLSFEIFLWSQNDVSLTRLALF